MSWNDVDLSTVTTTIEPLALGDYVFELLPGTALSGDGKRIECSASVTEGPFAGRRVYFSFPDPTQFDWAPRVLKRFITYALGEDTPEGTHPVQVLASASGKRFSGEIKEGKTSEAYPTPKRELNIFKLKPAA